ncbi:cholesterol 7-desaturase nvd-like [Dermacentor andersoni]|uniref:cholesterol 7-desaturase nvd-like n=1 Tax=Dermacentor andersoni TaxID=34620 RepID=UPI003B3BE2B8
MDGSGAFGRSFDRLPQKTSGTAISLDAHAFATAATVALIAVSVCYFWHKKKLVSDSEKPMRTRTARAFKNCPPVFPNGWIPVLESAQLQTGEVKALNVIGLELVAFRTEDGVAHVLDAYCPHLGAHLGVMGRVVGDCIECPFHGWRFQGDTGACTHVPYAVKAKGVIRGIPLEEGSRTINSKIVNDRNPTALAAKRLSNTTTVIIASEYLKVPTLIQRPGQVQIDIGYRYRSIPPAQPVEEQSSRSHLGTGPSQVQIQSTPPRHSGGPGPPRKVPEFVKATRWESRESLGLLFVWYHADRAAPSWELPDVAEVEKGLWREEHRFEHIVEAHIQDIAENGADLGHFNQIHRASCFLTSEQFQCTLGNSWWGRLVNHSWQATWTPHEHTASVDVAACVSVFGTCPDFLKHRVQVLQVGPALVLVRMRSRHGDCLIIQSLTPVAPFRVRLVHRFYPEPQLPWIIRRLNVLGFRHMVERDIAVWNHKTYLKQPALVKEDRMIVSFRKWFSQFYSESSPKWREVMEMSLDW